MAFTFDGVAKTITHSGGTLSVAEMWSRYVDWLSVGDNSKYGSMLYTVGRDKDDIALYVFLEPGVRIVVSNNTIPTVVTAGVLKTSDDSDPFGGAVVNVRYDKPVSAIGYSSNGVTGPSAADIVAAVRANLSADLDRLTEAWARLGLDPSRPVVQNETQISFGTVLLALSEAGGAVTVARQ